MMSVGFAAILTAITVSNAESTISDLGAAGVAEAPAHVWIWEATSLLAWLSFLPIIWRVVSRIRLSRPPWWSIAMIGTGGLLIASTWHIVVMLALRHLAYLVRGESYRFEGGLTHPYLYEFRKDVATYLQFVAVLALAQWLLAHVRLLAMPITTQGKAQFLEVVDGTMRHRVPLDTIDHITAAGNYVEIAAGGRKLLHRATLAAVERELGSDFVRIHRSCLVRRAAIRRVENDRSGDFVVRLADDKELRGSRRYRDAL